MKNYKFNIIGKVQGVYYRANVQKSASKLSFVGYVKNLNDGSVEACVTCKESKLEEFIAILKKGSMLSRVDSINQEECEETFLDSFEIRK